MPTNGPPIPTRPTPHIRDPSKLQAPTYTRDGSVVAHALATLLPRPRTSVLGQDFGQLSPYYAGHSILTLPPVAAMGLSLQHTPPLTTTRHRYPVIRRSSTRHESWGLLAHCRTGCLDHFLGEMCSCEGSKEAGLRSKGWVPIEHQRYSPALP